MNRNASAGLVGLVISMYAPVALAASDPEAAHQTLSPYFLVSGGERNAESFPLESSAANIDVAGVIARVRVTQIYRNRGGEPLEAVYVFPASTRAAVFAMKMKVGERTIEAEIGRKNEARKKYEKAKSAGQTASLLEQERPNVFQMSVANIMPGDRVEVVLDYVEALEVTGNTYELVYPTVVGPRYSEKSAQRDPEESWVANPHLRKGQAPPYSTALSARINAGVPIHGLRSTSHRISPRFSSRDRAEVVLDEPDGGNRDFVLQYRLTGQSIEPGVLLFPGEEESYFLAQLQPPARLNPSIVPPREYIFILDVSGSMSGFPLQTARRLMTRLMVGLDSRDRINVMMFSGGRSVLASRSLDATPKNLARARRFMNDRSGGGGTRIRPALEQALAMPRSENMSTSFVVVTDGFVSVEPEVFRLIGDNLGTANLFAFGIGQSVNRHLIEGMARAGRGEPFVVLGPDKAESEAEKFLEYISSPVLTRVKVDFDGFDAYDVVPAQIPDVFSQRPVVILGKYKGKARGHIRLEGRNGQGRFSAALNVVDRSKGAEHNSALRYLWARHRIRALSDELALRPDHADTREAITQLGLEHSLLTQFTSFVAVDQRVRNQTGGRTVVRQPLPMPEGVSNAAVGGMSAHGSVGYGAGGGGLAYGAGRGRGMIHLRGRGKSRPSIRGQKTTIRGSVSKGAIQRVLSASHRKLQKIYEKRLLQNPSLSGILTLKIIIAPNGLVKAVHRVSSTLGDEVFERQLMQVVKRLRFPVAPGGGVVEIRYPLKFEPPQ